MAEKPMEEINKRPSIISRPPTFRKAPTIPFPPIKESTRPVRCTRSVQRELERVLNLRDLTEEERMEIGRQIRESKGFDVTIPEGARPCAGSYFNVDLTNLNWCKEQLQLAVEEVKKRKGRSLKFVNVEKLVLYDHRTHNFTLKMRDGKLDKFYRAQIVCSKFPRGKWVLTYFEDTTPGVIDPSVEGSPNPNLKYLFAKVAAEAGPSSDLSAEAGPSSGEKDETNSKKRKREESSKAKAKTKTKTK